MLIRDDAQSPKLVHTIRRAMGKFTTDRLNADVMIVSDPAELKKTDLCAIMLRGGYVVTPQVLLMGRGACVKYKRATKIKRFMFATAHFQNKHHKVWDVIRRCALLPSSNWSILATKEEFSEKNRLARTSVFALAASRDQHGDQALVANVWPPSGKHPAICICVYVYIHICIYTYM